MNCMKCGRETISEQVFCEDCLLEMKKYPVRPGTVVQIPLRRESSQGKKPSKKRSIPLEDQVKHLKKRVRWLSLALVIALAAAALLVKPAVEHLLEDNFKIGQNYTTIQPTEPTGE